MIEKDQKITEEAGNGPLFKKTENVNVRSSNNIFHLVFLRIYTPKKIAVVNGGVHFSALDSQNYVWLSVVTFSQLRKGLISKCFERVVLTDSD